MTGQNWGLSGLKNIWPVIRTGDLLSDILSPAFLSSGPATKLYFHVNFSKKNSIVLTPNMAASSRGCKPRIQSTLSIKTNNFGTGTVNLVPRVLPYQSRRREPWERCCVTVCVHRFLLCFPRQHWIQGGGERFFIWQQCAFSSGQPKNIGIFVMCLNRFCLRTVTL